MAQIDSVALEIQREPFVRPFAFKGSAFHEKWNLVVRLTDGDGNQAYGIGGLAVLWSDPEVFAAHTETGGNALMTSVLEFALQSSRKIDWTSPPELLAQLMPLAHEFAIAVTGRRELRPTFTLNALVALDNAAWVLHARQRGLQSFDDMLPESSTRLLRERQQRILVCPAVGYNLPEAELQRLLAEGAAILKIKVGQPGDEDEMLRKDCEALSRIHAVASSHNTSLTDNGEVLYYLDANGRYSSKGHVSALLDHTDRIGMLEDIILLEEPFADAADVEVADLPVRVAADESLHSATDVAGRRELGYGAIAIKAAGKTLSLALDMVAAAQRCDMVCFAADNACVPILVEWNKNVAARLPAFPGVKGGIIESNGPENYGRWAQMLEEHPRAGAPWLEVRDGAYELDDDFYQVSGGILDTPRPYSDLISC